MKKLSAAAIGFTFTGCFLGAGYVSGQELYQFFGTFGGWGIVGLFLAVAALGVLNMMIIKIVDATGDARIDHVVVASGNKVLLGIVGFVEMAIFFGTYVVMAAGAGALIESLTGVGGAHIWGGFLFCMVISLLAIRGIVGLIKLFSGVVPILVVFAVAIGTAAMALFGGDGITLAASTEIHPLIPNFFAGGVTFASYNLFCSIGVLCPIGLRIKSKRAAKMGTVYGCIMLVFVAFAVLFSMAAVPGATEASLPMLAVAGKVSPVFGVVYAVLLFMAMSGASLACLVPTVTYFSEKSKHIERHGAVFTFAASVVAFLLSCVGFADLVGTVFSFFGYLSLFAVLGIVQHYLKIRKKK